ncbi:MAG: hypothetical protein AABM33_09495 [Pseudomonadota bacterium]
MQSFGGEARCDDARTQDVAQGEELFEVLGGTRTIAVGDGFEQAVGREFFGQSAARLGKLALTRSRVCTFQGDQQKPGGDAAAHLADQYFLRLGCRRRQESAHVRGEDQPVGKPGSASCKQDQPERDGGASATRHGASSTRHCASFRRHG